MIQVWRYGDENIPKVIADAAFRGGDEDWVIAGPDNDEAAFEFVVNRLDSNEMYRRSAASEVPYTGKNWLVYTVCHA